MAANRNNKGIAAYIAVAAALIIAFFVIFPKLTDSSKDTQYSEVISYFDDYKVKSYTLDLGTGELKYTLEGEDKVRTYEVPNVSIFLDDTDSEENNYRAEYNKRHPDAPLEQDYKKIKDNSWLISVIPTVLLLVMGIVLFFFMMKQAGGGGKYTSFGKANIKNQNHQGKKVTFADVAGADEEKHEMEEIVDFLKNPKKYSDIGARIPKGVLLLGPPGTGKTLLAKAVAGEAGCPFFPISGSDFVEMFVGVGASRVRDLFEQAKKNAPSIIFIDEIDAVGRQRGTGLGGGHDEREQTLNQLLVEMDGFTGNESVIVIAATNRRDILDPALLRPGRFDRQIVVDVPDVKGREAILKVHSAKKPLANDVDLEEIAKATAGYSGADLENLMNESAIFAARRNHLEITRKDIEDANLKVMMGTEKRSRIITEKEKKLTAFHEAGHAVLAKLVDKTSHIHKVSIIPRGRAGGYTMYVPDEDKMYTSKNEMLDRIIVMLGGRVAEELTMDDISTGASSDIQRATDIARQMVTKYGMSEAIGPVSYDDGGEVFIGRDFAHSKAYSEKTAADIDAEVKHIMTLQYQKTEQILTENMAVLTRVAEKLLEKETIDGQEFEECFNI